MQESPPFLCGTEPITESSPRLFVSFWLVICSLYFPLLPFFPLCMYLPLLLSPCLSFRSLNYPRGLRLCFCFSSLLCARYFCQHLIRAWIQLGWDGQPASCDLSGQHPGFRDNCHTLPYHIARRRHCSMISQNDRQWITKIHTHSLSLSHRHTHTHSHAVHTYTHTVHQQQFSTIH